MSNYIPSPFDGKVLGDYLQRELRKIASCFNDDADRIFYRSLPVPVGQPSAANWKAPIGNVLLISASVTTTLTGMQRMSTPQDARQERVFVCTGAPLVLTSQDATSSASNRFALPATWTLSLNASALIWRDPIAFRWRGISRT